MPNQSVYLEIAGSAGSASMNYDRKLNNAFTARAGYGRWVLLRSVPVGDQDNDYARVVPLTLNFMKRLPSQDAEWLELGVGMVGGVRWSGVEQNPKKRFSAATAHLAYRAMAGQRVWRLSISTFAWASDAFPHRRARPGVSVGLAF